jgi:hypothetical protein
MMTSGWRPGWASARACSTPRRRRQGGFTLVTVPANAARTIAAEEFNRYYIRAVCRLALKWGISHLEVYRARAARNLRFLDGGHRED